MNSTIDVNNVFGNLEQLSRERITTQILFLKQQTSKIYLYETESNEDTLLN